MANTYSQINIHAIFAVKGRENLLKKSFREELFKYMSGILKSKNQFSLCVNGHNDHVHVFFELSTSTAISDIIRDVKANSSRWINENKFVPGKFSWQEGYGAFSYSRSQRNNVIQYIMDQEKHHQKKSFKEEYLGLLEKFEIAFQDEYMFDFIER
ncbi:IS200/IS605 family transposase [Marinifilum sp. D737]|uniref:IS200/IS605 family transposase n=1 Tax=Marinifilum sp. D737 TaxID=2969628 RepID=UPI0022744A13|nr:IS200/IS605 family transposase [Marinifilum sp. D737]MCY1635204.1 IS200/IS605 family transposase [Marinifilum sp. D737]